MSGSELNLSSGAVNVFLVSVDNKLIRRMFQYFSMSSKGLICDSTFEKKTCIIPLLYRKRNYAKQSLECF